MFRSLTSITYGLLAVGVAVAAGVFWLQMPGAAGGGQGGRGGVSVGTVIVAPATFLDRLDALGTGQADESIVITARETETVEAVYFEEGQPVEANAVLVELTSNEEAGSLQAARARLAETEADLKRTQQLIASGNVSAARLDQALSARDSAAGSVRSLEARLNDRLIRAPFAGIVGLRHVSPGALVRPGDVIATLDATRTIKVEFDLPEIYLGRLAAGQKVIARSPAYADREFVGAIDAIDSRVDITTRTIKVRAPIDNPDLLLKPGMLLSLEIVREEKMFLAVPERAIVSQRDGVSLLRIKEGKIERVPVELGMRQNGLVAVLSGLSAGDEIVSDGIHKVREGQGVQIVERDGAPVSAPAGKTGS